MRVRLLSLFASAVLVLLAAVPASASSEGHSYLALGDSVPFGFHPNPALWSDISNMVGYPEFVAEQLDIKDVNASCPGEATGGFLSLSGTDNGCRTFRASGFPLHVSYTTSQRDFAVSYLRTHKRTRLVTLMIGANDVFVLEHQCTPAGSITPDPACVLAGLPGVLGTMQANLNTIFADLRATGYEGLIVAVTYYALDYRDVSGPVLLNGPMIAAASTHGILIADGLAAWAPLANGGSSCTAGLLLPAFPSTKPGCDVHPTLLGHRLLANAVVDAVADSCPAHSAKGCLDRNQADFDVQEEASGSST